MKYKTRILGSLIFAASMLLGNDVSAQPERDTDKTLSPYFFVKSNDPEVDQLPLKSTSVEGRYFRGNCGCCCDPGL